MSACCVSASRVALASVLVLGVSAAIFLVRGDDSSEHERRLAERLPPGVKVEEFYEKLLEQLASAEGGTIFPPGQPFESSHERSEMLAELPRTSLVVEARVRSASYSAGLGTVVFDVLRTRSGSVDGNLTLRFFGGPARDESLMALSAPFARSSSPTFRPGESVLLCVDGVGESTGSVWRIGRFRKSGELLPVVLAERMPDGNLEAPR